MNNRKNLLTRLAITLTVFGWGYFLFTWFMEKFFPPMWVMADPSAGVAGTNFKMALVLTGIGAVLYGIDYFVNSRRSEF